MTAQDPVQRAEAETPQRARGHGRSTAAAHWLRVKPLLATLLEAEPGARAALATTLAAGDTDLANELRALAAASEAEALERLPTGLGLAALEAQAGKRARPGQRFGPWRAISLIASGGMGEVYRGERADGLYEQHVAIKLMRSGFDAQWLRTRFEEERRILASLDHPNLARVLDGGTSADGVPYFVMELVEGEPIDRYCDRLGLGMPARLALFRTVCAVVGHAHGKGVVHRDLKAENLLVTAQGEVKLVDFGIAKQTAGPGEQTATAERVMTLLYASPEQVNGQAVTPASDVYSLGVVLYRLLTGTSPYPKVTSSSGYELGRAICDTEPPPPSRAEADAAALTQARRRQLRGDLDAVVAKALRKDPAARYGDANELGDDIVRHLRHEPVRARRGAWTYRSQRFVQRHRTLVVGAALANAALIAGLALALAQNVEANRQRERALRISSTVRALANTFLFDFHDAVAPLAGSLPARQMLVDKALVYLQDLSAESRDDPVLQRELAIGFRKVGNLQSQPSAPSLGNAPGALQSHSRSIELLRPLVPAGDGAAGDPLRHELSVSLGAKAAVLGRMGRADEALALLQESTRLEDTVLKHTPDDVQSLNTRGASTGSISWMLHERGDFAGFLAQSAQSEALLQRVLQLEPTHMRAAMNLASTHARRGTYFLGAVGQPGSARKAFDEFSQEAGILERIVAAQPNDSWPRSGLIESKVYMGKALMQLDEPGRAIDTLGHAADEMAQLMGRDLQDDKLRAQLVEVRVALASAQLAAGRVDAAREQAGRAIDDFGQLTAASQANVYFAHEAANAHYVAGLALAGLAAQAGLTSAGGRRLKQQSCDALRASLSMLAREGTLPQSSQAELTQPKVQAAAAGCPDKLAPV